MFPFVFPPGELVFPSKTLQLSTLFPVFPLFPPFLYLRTRARAREGHSTREHPIPFPVSHTRANHREHREQREQRA